jgi:hypothetical protein
VKLLGAVPLLAAVLALPASAQYRPGYPAPYRGGGYGYGTQGALDGFITADSGRCLVLRDHQRRTFYLSGDTAALRPGDHVSLRGRTVSRSSCGANGPTLEVLDVRTVWTGGSHRSAYFDARRDGNFERFVERSRDRGGWYSDRYSYMQQGGDSYGQYAPPNGPYGPGGQPPYPGGPQYQGQPQYQGPPQGAPDQGQPQYDPNDQYGPNGQGQPPPPQYDPNGGQPEQNGQYDNPQGYDQNGADSQQPVSVEGTLDFNGSCPAVRDGNGASYDLAGNLRGFHNGERVRVTGVLSGSSSCGGTALEIQEIRERR